MEIAMPRISLFRMALVALLCLLLAACVQIGTQPQSATVTAGQVASFSVTATSTTSSPLTYQWYRNGAAISGATSASYAFTASSADNGAGFYVSVNDGSLAVQSSTATLTVTPAQLQLSLVAGNIGGPGNLDGQGANARFSYPGATAVDGSGNVYVADTGSFTIRKLTAAGVVTTLAGAAGLAGHVDGSGSAARFGDPIALAASNSGTVYVVDASTTTTPGDIRKITPAGVVTTLTQATTPQNCQDGPLASASFSGLFGGIVLDSAGNIYVSDLSCNGIRKISTANVVSTVATLDGAAGSGLAMDSSGNFYLSENYTIQKVVPGVGSSLFAGSPGTMGCVDGAGAAAQFNGQLGLGMGSGNTLWVADGGANTVRSVSPAGVVTTVAGNTSCSSPSTYVPPGSTNGSGTAARFNNPIALSVDGAGNVYIADRQNDAIRKMTPTAQVSTLAGLAEQIGHDDGVGAAASFNFSNLGVTGTYVGQIGPSWGLIGGNLSVDAAGNTYITDYSYCDIRKVSPTGLTSTLVSSSDLGYYACNAGGIFLGATAVDASGKLYVSAAGAVNVYAPDGSLSNAVSIAANSSGFMIAGQGMAVDSAGNVYIDIACSVHKLAVGDTAFQPFAGSWGQCGSSDGSGTSARFAKNGGLAVDAAGNLYVADGNIRKVSPTGVVTTLATASAHTANLGSGPYGSPDWSADIALDSSGNIYAAAASVRTTAIPTIIPDLGSTISKITPTGTVTTLLGVPGQVGIVTGLSPATLSVTHGVAVAGHTLYITSGDTALLKATLP
jgi:sugar lactone lactonase YvrE